MFFVVEFIFSVVMVYKAETKTKPRSFQETINRQNTVTDGFQICLYAKIVQMKFVNLLHHHSSPDDQSRVASSTVSRPFGLVDNLSAGKCNMLWAVHCTCTFRLLLGNFWSGISEPHDNTRLTIKQQQQQNGVNNKSQNNNKQSNKHCLKRFQILLYMQHF